MSRHGEDSAASPRRGASRDARRDLRARLLAPGLGADEAREIAERVGWRPVATLISSPRCPAARRRLLEEAISDRATRIPDGEVIALCRIASETILRTIASRRSAKVLSAVLSAPRVTEAVAALVRERNDLPLSTRQTLLAESRFAGPAETDLQGRAS